MSKRRRIQPSAPTDVSPEAEQWIKDLRGRGQDQPFSHLPPDVTVSHIFPHLQSSGAGLSPSRRRMRFFGRFIRDGLRHPWFLFRNIEITSVDIFWGVVASLQADPQPNKVQRAISDALPRVNHKQVMRYTMDMCGYGVVGNLALDYFLGYRRFRDVEFDRNDMQLPNPDAGKFEIHFERVMKRLFVRKMPMLQTMDGNLWTVMRFFNLDQCWSASTRNLTIDFAYIPARWFPTYSSLALSEPCDAVTKISGIALSFGAPSTQADFHRLFQDFPKLTSLHFDEYSPMPQGFLLLDLKFQALFDDGRPLHELWLPDRVTYSPRISQLTRRVTKSLRVSAGGMEIPMPRISDTLKKLGLHMYDIPRDSITPYEVIFDSCRFPDETTVLCDRTKKVTFTHNCVWPTEHVTISSNALVSIHWACDIANLENLTLETPNLKRVKILTGRKYAITINSDHVLDDFVFVGPVARGGVPPAISLKHGVRFLMLNESLPDLDGPLDTVEKLYLNWPPGLSIINKRRGYDKMTNIKLLHVVSPYRRDWTNYRMKFNAKKVVFE